MSDTPLDQDVKNKFGVAPQNIMTDLAPLPSHGKIYPIGSSLHGKSHIEVKILTAREENILNNRANLRQGTAIDKLLRACIIDKTVNPDDLIVGDKNAVLLFIRIMGYGAEYKVDMKCENCGKNFNTAINLASIKIRELEKEPIELGTNLFKFTLPKSKKLVKFHLLTTKDDAEIDKAEEGRKKAKLEATPITTRLYYQVDEIEGVENKDKMKFIDDMFALDSKELRQYIDATSPEPIMKSEVTCTYCDETYETLVPIGLGFFWPRGDN